MPKNILFWVYWWAVAHQYTLKPLFEWDKIAIMRLPSLQGSDPVRVILTAGIIGSMIRDNIDRSRSEYIMSKLSVLLAAAILTTACTPVITPTTTPVPVIPTGAATATFTAAAPAPSPTGIPAAPDSPAGTPTAAGSNIDPLTGLTADTHLLDRRPLVVKVENLPRGHRPQWGLTQADLVYEYYTEQGTSRFAAVYYSKDSPRVGPIRSGRFFDANVVDMYKAVFAFGSAYSEVLDRFKKSDFADRMVVEENNNCPPMCRFEPQGSDMLVTNTADLSAYITQKGVPNGRQDLTGMTFQAAPPAGGQPATQVYARFSGAIYNRWDFDPASGQYFRWVDSQDDFDNNHEVYVKLTDKANGQQISADNVVMLYVPYVYYNRTAVTQVFEVNLVGTGPAYVARNGMMYAVQWQRLTPDAVLTLVGADGKPFPLQPGTTWFEVMHSESLKSQTGTGWRFTFVLPK
jgi:hypothetical protein